MRFVVPWRPDDGVRSELWAFCKAWWTERLPDAELVESPSPDGPFNRAAAINAGAAGSWDLLGVLDADVLCPPEQVREGIARARASDALTFPFERFSGLDKPSTRRVLAGGDPAAGRVRFATRHHFSSVLIVPRRVWDVVGGFDERFVGWGQEDVAFAHVARMVAPIERVPGKVFHLEHDSRAERGKGTPRYEANQALGRAYGTTRSLEEARAVREGTRMSEAASA